MPVYADLSEIEQVEILHTAAHEAAVGFGLGGASVRSVLHAYNSTFRVDVGDASWAMRILLGSTSGPPQIAAEQTWQLALAAEAGVAVPVPLRAADGTWSVEVESPRLGRTAVATVAGWLQGTEVGDDLDVATAHLLGATMARMHVHAATWTMPDDGTLSVLDDVLFGERDALTTVADLDADHRGVLDRARDRSQAVLTSMHAADHVRPLHADLHGGNLQRAAEGLQILDFDDAGLGVPALDLAIARFSLDDPAQHAALTDGYASVAPLPDVAEADLHALAAGRQLLLANDLLSTTSATLRADARGYLDRAVLRLRAWLDTGVFTRTVA